MSDHLDIAETVGRNEIFAGALVRVFAPGPGELVVERFPRSLVGRMRNRLIERVDGFFAARFPVNWTLPMGQVTPFLIAMHGSGNSCLFFRAYGKAVSVSGAGPVGECYRVEFESFGTVLATPRGVNPDLVLHQEYTLLDCHFREHTALAIALTVYHDWLWENAKHWVRRQQILATLKDLAKRTVNR